MEAENDHNVTLQNSSNASNTTISAASSSSAINVKVVNISRYFKFPPGYKFRPSGRELVIHYLRRKVRNEPLPPNNMVVVDLYSHNPKDLAETYKDLGEDAWYFFTPRIRKYPNGKRPNRSTGDGYWKANGADETVELSDKTIVGYKKVLDFHIGHSPTGIKTNWMMHEFKLNEPSRTKEHEKDMKLDDWVLCKIYQKPDCSDQNTTRKKYRKNNRKNQTRFDEDGKNGGDHMETHFESNDAVFNPNSAHVEDNTTNDGHQILSGLAQGYNNEVPNAEGNLQYNNLASLMAPQGFYSLSQNNTMPIKPNHHPRNNYLEDVVYGHNPDGNNLGSVVNWDNNPNIVPNHHNPDNNYLESVVNWDNNSGQVDQWDINNMSSTVPVIGIPTNYPALELTLDEYSGMMNVSKLRAVKSLNLHTQKSEIEFKMKRKIKRSKSHQILLKSKALN